MRRSHSSKIIAPPGAEEIEFSAIDRHFARLMVELNGTASPELERAAQLVSAWREAGHICLPLESVGMEELDAKLRETRVVGRPGEAKPLILDARHRLYLQRYWHYEDSLAHAIAARLDMAPGVDEKLLADGLERFFGPNHVVNWQRRAAMTAVKKNFCVVTGAPGTGKTRTVVIILALLIEQFRARGKAIRIALAAPTGKAAARLKEAIQTTADILQIEAATRLAIPSDVTTLHRLLGTIPNSPYFRHHASRPLASDAVIIDEASMVDLALMANLVSALRDDARLILLGDKDQLASVEAGSVLGDICHAPREAISKAPIRDHIVELKTNYRFRDDSGIHRLSTLVNAGQPEEALAFLQNGPHPDVIGLPLPLAEALAPAVKDRVAGGKKVGSNPDRRKEVPPRDAAEAVGFGDYLETTDPRAALLRFDTFRILCAVRRGPFGTENLNHLVEETLAAEGLIRPESGLFYHGRPVLVLRNDAQLKLFNGDVGLILADPDAGGELRAFFLDTGGDVRRLPPARLPAHETVFAMTVHKSQGSEFERVLFVLPDRESPVVSRELIYTAITRASKAVEIWFRDTVLRAGIVRTIERSSGLGEALWNRQTA